MWPFRTTPRQEPDARYEVAYVEALRMISEQQASLDNLRSRVGVLVSVAALATSFLGDAAFREGRELGGWGLVAIAAFVILLVPALSILLPREWTFKNSPKKIIGTNIEDANQPIDRLWRDLALHLEVAYDNNETRLDGLMRRYGVAIALLGVEVVAWLLELGLADFLAELCLRCP